jgi:hypothetical protein
MFDTDVWTIKKDQEKLNDKKNKSYSTIRTPFKKKNNPNQPSPKQSKINGHLETDFSLGFNTV